MESYDVVVIGAGVMGTSTACELARRGASVAVVDQSSLPNPRGASVDHSKVFRFAYPDPLYVRMAVDALELWRALEEESSTRLMTKTGTVLLGLEKPSFETRCYDALKVCSLEAELLSSNEAVERFPQFDPRAFSYAVFDPSGAILHAETAVRALLDLARRLGVKVIEGERVHAIEEGDSGRARAVKTETGRQLYCGAVIVASGPWTRELVPQVSSLLTATRQEVFYFEPVDREMFDPTSFPIFISLDTGFYGFPVHHAGAMKIANHHKGNPVDPYCDHPGIVEESIETCRAFFRAYIPPLRDARFKEARVCMYNNTPDDDFLIDHHPGLENVLLVTGFSGHGFKFGP
ncbi:MAG TPA: N-methyl-L-tryptophan oxidase, partial [Blastocatellia bacterium]|nr:N-methyl-L-tryptophan oxidase [Blastocatellia bacterium]